LLHKPVKDEYNGEYGQQFAGFGKPLNNLIFIIVLLAQNAGFEQGSMITGAIAARLRRPGPPRGEGNE